MAGTFDDAKAQLGPRGLRIAKTIRQALVRGVAWSEARDSVVPDRPRRSGSTSGSTPRKSTRLGRHPGPG